MQRIGKQIRRELILCCLDIDISRSDCSKRSEQAREISPPRRGILKTFKFTLTSSFHLTLYHPMPMSFLVQPPCNHHFFIESSHIGFGWFTILISDSEQKFGISNRCLCSVVYTLHKNLQWETEFNSTRYKRERDNQNIWFTFLDSWNTMPQFKDLAKSIAIILTTRTINSPRFRWTRSFVSTIRQII